MSTPLTSKFCTACANPLIATAVICPKCGSPVSGYKYGIVGGKSKTTAVVLAVFFGSWSWLYTYKASAKKFWVTICILFGLPFFMFLGVFVAANSGNGRGVQGWMVAATVIIWYFFVFGFWVWSIIDNAVKSEAWYRSYLAN